jgi:hypothetical protein
MLRSTLIVIVEHSAELLLTSDTTHLWEKLRLQEFVLDPLMIAPMAIEQHNTIEVIGNKHGFLLNTRA